VPCEGGQAPLTRAEAEILLKQVPGWELSADSKVISKEYKFKNFKEALEFINKVGEIAESEGHHPDMHLTNYRQIKIELSTHAIKGLSQNDFILAAKIDK
jgi:4a-hydroxytetrahydrobiopterin dehydratase